MVGEIPFDDEVNRVLMRGRILVQESSGPASVALRRLADVLARGPTKQ